MFYHSHKPPKFVDTVARAIVQRGTATTRDKDLRGGTTYEYRVGPYRLTYYSWVNIVILKTVWHMTIHDGDFSYRFDSFDGWKRKPSRKLRRVLIALIEREGPVRTD